MPATGAAVPRGDPLLAHYRPANPWAPSCLYIFQHIFEPAEGKKLLGVVFFAVDAVLAHFIHHERRPSDPTQIKNGVLLTCALRHFRGKARDTSDVNKTVQNFGQESVYVYRSRFAFTFFQYWRKLG